MTVLEPPPPLPPPPPATVNGPRPSLATAALVLSIIPLIVTGIIGAVLGLVYLLDTRAGARRRGQAIAAIVLGVLALLVGLALGVAATVHAINEDRSTDPQSSTSRSEPEFAWAYPDELEVGDCATDTVDDVGFRVKVVPCSDSHRSEVYAIEDLPTGDYPGRGATIGQAEDVCYDAFEEFVGTSYEESFLTYWYYHPLEEDWPDDRSVVCLVESDWDLTESAQGSER